MTLLDLQQGFRTWLTREPADLPPVLDEQLRAGLHVYLNNYRSQLLACLSASFPVLRTWIGDTRFDGAAAHHIDRVPPHEWTLDAYGLDFPETLASLYPNDPEIAELARLECELALAFVRTDAEPLDPATLIDIDWDSAVIRLTPSFMMLGVATNAAAIWSAINAGETPPGAALLAEPATLAIWRHHFAPRFRTLSAEEAGVLAQVRNGETFGGICAEQGAASAGAFLAQWLSDGLLADITSRFVRDS